MDIQHLSEIETRALIEIEDGAKLCQPQKGGSPFLLYKDGNTISLDSRIVEILEEHLECEYETIEISCNVYTK